MLSIHHYIYYTILLRATIFTATLSSGQLNLFAERWYWPIGRCVGLCRFYLQNDIKARWGSAELERRRIMWQMWWHGAESKESSVHLHSFARLINKTYRSMIWSWHKIELSFKLRPFAIRGNQVEPQTASDFLQFQTLIGGVWRSGTLSCWRFIFCVGLLPISMHNQSPLVTHKGRKTAKLNKLKDTNRWIKLILGILASTFTKFQRVLGSFLVTVTGCDFNWAKKFEK